MQLQCADILHTLRHKPIFISGQMGEPFIASVSDRRRQDLLSPLLPQIHRAHKFIFDSGSDQDTETVKAVRETAVNMIEAGLFHQPFPLMWIEDPYEGNEDTHRNFYLALEERDNIVLFLFAQMKDLQMLKVPPLVFHPFPLRIPLSFATDDFTADGLHETNAMYSRVLGEAVYSYKKLIVTLASRNTEVERIQPSASKRRVEPRHRTYEHQVIRIPLENMRSSDGNGAGNKASGSPRRRRLVRGYMYGKNTRPLAQQKWISPYWRGDGEPEERTTHYEVG